MFDFEDSDITLPEPLPESGPALDALPKADLARRFNGLIAAVRGLAAPNMDAVMLELRKLQDEQRAQREQLAQAPAAQGVSEREFGRFSTSKGLNLVGRTVNLGGAGEDAVEVWQPGLLDEQEPLTEWHRELQSAVEARSFARVMVARESGTHAPTPKCDARIRRLIDQGPPAVKADAENLKKRIFSGNTGSGGDWQQSTVLPMLGQALRMAPDPLEQLFETIDIPTKTVTLPFATSMPKPYRYGIPTGDNPADFVASTPETTSRSWTADGMACVIQVFDDASEDSIISTLPLLQGMAVNGLRLGFCDAIINGDTAATHQDSALGSWNPRSMFDSNASFGTALDHRKGFIGLRAMAFDASNTRDASGDSTSWTTQTLKTAMAALKAPHGVAGELVYLASPEHYISNILVDTNVLTVDKFGPNAAIQAGQVAKVLNCSVMTHELVTSDLQATGLFTTTGGTYGSGILFNRSRFKIIQRKGVMVELERRAINGVTYIVVVARKTFRTIDAATDKVVHVSYKV